MSERLTRQWVTKTVTNHPGESDQTDPIRRGMLRSAAAFAGLRAVNRLTPWLAAAAWTYKSPITAGVEVAIVAQEGLKAYESQVIFPPEQQKLLENPENDTMWLCFGGAAWRSASELASVLTPTLGRGEKPVGHIKYAINSVDTQSIAEGIAETLEEYPHIKKIRIYGHSLGVHVSAESLALVRARFGKDFELEQVLMDSTPINTDATRLSVAGDIVKFASLFNTESVGLTAANNQMVYHDIFRKNSAPPSLLWEQYGIMQDGDYYMNLLADLAASDGTEVYFLRTEDPDKDVVEDPRISQSHYERMFRKFKAIMLNGRNPNHANPLDNIEEYDAQIRAHVPA